MTEPAKLPPRIGAETTAASLRAVVGGSFARSVLLVLQGLLVSRFLGAEGYGEFSLALAFVSLVFGVIDFRVQHAVIKFMAEVEERPLAERHLLALFFLSFEIGKGVVGLAAAVGLGYVYTFHIQDLPALMPVVVALSLHKLAMTANPTTTAFLRLAGKFRAIALYDLGFGLVSVFAVGATAALVSETAAVAYAYLAVGVVGGLAKTVLTWWLLRPALAPGDIMPLLRGWRGAELPWRRITRFILGVNLAATCQMAAKNLDVMILGRFVSLEVVGWYSLASRLKNLFAYFTDPLLIVLYPEFARAWAAQRYAWLRSALHKSMGWGVVLGTAGFIGLAIVSGYLITPLFGAGYAGTGFLLWFFLPDAVANVACFALPHLVLAMGRAGDIFYGSLARLLVVALLGALLTSWWGASGMAVAVGLATSLNMLLLARAAERAFASRLTTESL